MSRLIVVFSAVALLASQAYAVTDQDVLNFALQVEYIEAEFFSYAAYGQGLSSQLCGGGPSPIGGFKASLSSLIQGMAEEFAQDEINHVNFIRTQLGAAAVPCPAMDINAAFAKAVNTALNTTLSPPFNPYASDDAFLIGTYILAADVGPTAYQGAIKVLSSPANIQASSAILGVEAYQAGATRTLMTQVGNRIVQPYGIPVKRFAEAISNLRSTVDGSGGKNLQGGPDDQGLSGTDIPTPIVAAPGPNTAEPTNFVPADPNGQVYARTTTQLLDILYLGSSTKPGGFFPNGLNGAINGVSNS